MPSNVLIVDDDRGNLSSLKMLLKYERKDLKVKSASSFDEAVSKLRRGGIDLVLSDVNLDAGNLGPDIKKLFQAIPFIYITGDPAWKSKDGSKVVYKPYTIDALSKVIDSVRSKAESVINDVSSGALSVDEAVKQLIEVSPPGFSGTTKGMKQRHSKEISNPWALSWWMYKRGAKPHIAPEPSPKGIKNYVKPSEYAKRKEGGKVTKMPKPKGRRLAASLDADNDVEQIND